VRHVRDLHKSEKLDVDRWSLKYRLARGSDGTYASSKDRYDQAPAWTPQATAFTNGTDQASSTPSTSFGSQGMLEKPIKAGAWEDNFKAFGQWKFQTCRVPPSDWGLDTVKEKA